MVINKIIENIKNHKVENMIFDGENIHREVNNLPSNITFENCTFSYIIFQDCISPKFINCTFNTCEFYNITNLQVESCTFKESSYIEISELHGICIFKNISELIVQMKYLDYIDPFLTIESINTPDISNHIEEINKIARENLTLRKDIKEGYVMAKMNVIVKLSIPEDAEVKNLRNLMHLTNKAKVEGFYFLEYPKHALGIPEKIVTNKLLGDDITIKYFSTDHIPFYSTPEALGKNYLSRGEFTEALNHKLIIDGEFNDDNFTKYYL